MRWTVVPVADAFMVVMISRPSSGSLRHTWVTPATLWLGIGSVVASICLLAALGEVSWGWRPLVYVLLTLFAVGALAVVAVAAFQRLARTS